jgi:HK97 family phage major capsid protein
MPYRAERSSKCPASKPWAAVKIATGEVMGCHASEADAQAQVAALYANEPAAGKMQRSIHGIEIKGLVEGKHDGLDGYFFSGTATTPRLDRIGDVVRPMGARFSKSAMPRVMLYHDSTKPVGQIVEAVPSDRGLPFKAFIPKVSESGTVRDRTEEALHSIKYKLLPAVSIGFKPDFKKTEQTLTGLEFKEWDWLELSLVTVPANPDAVVQMTGVKSIDDRLLAVSGKITKPTRRIFLPGVPGDKPAVTSSTKGTKMFDIRKTLDELREKREQSVQRRDELAEKAKEEGSFSALSRDELAEHDQIALKDLPELDAEIARWSAHEGGASIATRVESVGSRDEGAAARGGRRKEQAQSEPGVAFAQYVKMMYRAKGMPMIALDLAQRSRNIDQRVVSFLKAAVSSGTTTGSATAGDWGMELVGHESNIVADFAAFLRPQTIIGKFGANGIPALRRVPFRVALVGMSSGGQGYWVGEGKPKPLTEFAFTRTHLEPLKVATMCVVTKELLSDSSPAADPLLRDELANALRERTDIDFVDPDKADVPGISPASITNGVTPIHSTGTGTAADVRTDVKAAFDAFIVANNTPTNGVWIMPETVALSLSMMVNALGQPEFPGTLMNGGRFAGLPVITSQNVTAASSASAGSIVILANASDIYFADDGGVVVDTSEHATIEMSSDPDSASGTQVGMFQTNRVAFRAERRLDWMKRRASAVQVISGVNWGNA